MHVQRKPYTVGNKTVFLSDEELEVFKMTMGREQVIGERQTRQERDKEDRGEPKNKSRLAVGQQGIGHELERRGNWKHYRARKSRYVTM